MSILSQEKQKKVFPNATITKTWTRVRLYTDEGIRVAGEMTVQVSYGKQLGNLILTIFAGNRRALLGRDWLHHLNLDWKIIGLASLPLIMGRLT